MMFGPMMNGTVSGQGQTPEGRAEPPAQPCVRGEEVERGGFHRASPGHPARRVQLRRILGLTAKLALEERGEQTLMEAVLRPALRLDQRTFFGVEKGRLSDIES